MDTNEDIFLSTKPDLRLKQAFDRWQAPAFFKRHPSKETHTLTKQAIVNDAKLKHMDPSRIHRRLGENNVEIDGSVFFPNLPYSLNKDNRWNMNVEELVEDKRSTNKLTYSFAKQWVTWNGNAFANPLANSYGTVDGDGELQCRQARSRFGAVPLNSLATKPRPSKKSSKNRRSKCDTASPAAELNDVDGDGVFEIKKPVIEIRYVLNSPHYSVAFADMKARKGSKTSKCKRIQRNRFYGAIVDGPTSKYESHDENDESDEDESFQTDRQTNVCLGDFLPPNLENQENENDEDRDWVIVNETKGRRNRSRKATQKQKQQHNQNATDENLPTLPSPPFSIGQMPSNWDQFPLFSTARVSVKKSWQFDFEEQTRRFQETSPIGQHLQWIVEGRQFSVDLLRRQFDATMAIAIVEKLDESGFRISVQCDYGDTDLKRSLDSFLRGISYRKEFFAVIFDLLVQRLDQRRTKIENWPIDTKYSMQLGLHRNVPSFVRNPMIMVPSVRAVDEQIDAYPQKGDDIGEGESAKESNTKKITLNECSQCQLVIRTERCWLSCHGPFCPECLRSQFSLQIQQSQLPIICPKANCGKPIPLPTLPTFLPLDTVCWYKFRLLQPSFPKEPANFADSYFACRNCKANLRPIHDHVLPGNTTLHCGVCDIGTCRLCDSPPHWPLNCEEMSRWCREWREPENPLKLNHVYMQRYRSLPYPKTVNVKDRGLMLDTEIEDELAYGRNQPSTLALMVELPHRVRQFRADNEIYVVEWSTKLYLMEMVTVWLRYNANRLGARAGHLTQLLREMAVTPYRQAGIQCEQIIADVAAILAAKD